MAHASAKKDKNKKKSPGSRLVQTKAVVEGDDVVPLAVHHEERAQQLPDPPDCGGNRWEACLSASGPQKACPKKKAKACLKASRWLQKAVKRRQKERKEEQKHGACRWFRSFRVWDRNPMGRNRTPYSNGPIVRQERGVRGYSENSEPPVKSNNFLLVESEHGKTGRRKTKKRKNTNKKGT